MYDSVWNKERGPAQSIGIVIEYVSIMFVLNLALHIKVVVENMNVPNGKGSAGADLNANSGK